MFFCNVHQYCLPKTNSTKVFGRTVTKRKRTLLTSAIRIANSEHRGRNLWQLLIFLESSATPAPSPPAHPSPPAPPHSPSPTPTPVLDLARLLLRCVVDEELIEVEVVGEDVAADVVASDGQAVVYRWVFPLGGHLCSAIHKRLAKSLIGTIGFEPEDLNRRSEAVGRGMKTEGVPKALRV